MFGVVYIFDANVGVFSLLPSELKQIMERYNSKDNEIAEEESLRIFCVFPMVSTVSTVSTSREKKERDCSFGNYSLMITNILYALMS